MVRGVASGAAHFAWIRPRSPVHDPVFIVGCGHSGTTVLRAVLGEHRDVFAVEQESNAFLRRQGARGLRLARHWFAAGTFAQVNAWYRMAEANGRSVIVEKTPRHVHTAQTLLRLWSGAHIVVCVREPLDVVASLVRRGASLEEAMTRWQEDNMAGVRISHDPRVHLFRYENFVADPQPAMDVLLSNLRLRPAPDLVERYENSRNSETDGPGPTDHNELRAWQVQQPIFDGRGTWRNTLDDASADLVRQRLQTIRLALGYP